MTLQFTNAFHLKILFKNWSIKQLTVVGFIAVILPITTALFFGVSQINQLSKHSTQGMQTVANIIAVSRQLNLSLIRMQRLASQSLILQDQELAQQYQHQSERLLNSIQQKLIPIHKDKNTSLIDQFISQINLLNSIIAQQPAPQISQIEIQFQQLNKTYQQIITLNEQLVSQQIELVETHADSSQTTMLKSLFIIPLSLGIALLFILLIVKPLAIISKKVKRLEQGKFNERITFSGAKEIKNIATALEQMRVQLKSLERQKSSFIRHISHELKTPLAAIREGTELLYDHSVGTLNEGQQEIALIIKSNVNRLQTLIEDLLDFNIVLDSSSLQSSEEVDINVLVKQCFTLRKLEIRTKNLTIANTLQATCIESNEKQLGVIIDNILSNAIKYSPNNSTINVTGAVKNQHYQLCISDQGPGLPPQLCNKVFDAFYQGPPPENSQIKSSGLGLTIVKELIRRLHGDIKLHSNTQPQGLTVTILLPINSNSLIEKPIK